MLSSVNISRWKPRRRWASQGPFRMGRPSVEIGGTDPLLLLSMDTVLSAHRSVAAGGFQHIQMVSRLQSVVRWVCLTRGSARVARYLSEDALKIFGCPSCVRCCVRVVIQDVIIGHSQRKGM